MGREGRERERGGGRGRREGGRGREGDNQVLTIYRSSLLTLQRPLCPRQAAGSG